MSLELVLQDTHTGQLHVITGPTIFGRAPTPEGSKGVLQVDGSRINVSRNHCIVELQPSGYVVRDLGSTNGTELTTKLGSNERRPIGIEDILVLDRSEGWGYMVVGIKDPKKSHALLIGYPGTPGSGNYLPGVKNDIEAMKPALEQRDYSDRTTVLFDYNATESNIMNQLERMASQSTEHSQNIIYFTGHGAKNGHMLIADGLLDPQKMLDKIANIPGNKAVVFDMCYAGNVLNEQSYRVPRNTLVLTASTEYEQSAEGQIDQIGGTKNGYFTGALLSELNDNSRPVDLRRVGINLQKFGLPQHSISIPQSPMQGHEGVIWFVMDPVGYK
tara:strand:- start:26025 stop:27014 length:990 start_codon:yes stop_codon:yes gene_type:complete